VSARSFTRILLFPSIQVVIVVHALIPDASRDGAHELVRRVFPERDPGNRFASTEIPAHRFANH
jgi:hypothetical protein